MRKLAFLLLGAMSAAHAQTSLVEYAETEGTSGVGVPPTGVNGTTGGSLTVYPTRVDFDAVFPVASQTCEDFENNNIADGAIEGFAAPLNSTTDNPFFAAGSIVDGLSVQDNPINDSDGVGAATGLVALGATAFGAPSDVVLANTFTDTIDIFFTAGNNGVAMDVFSFTAGGTATVSYFDAGDNLLGTLDVAAGTAVGGFAGVSSDTPIARANIRSVDGGGADEAEGGDNICFANGGGIDLPEPQEIPTLNPWGLLLLALGLFGLSGLMLRKEH